MIQLIPSKRTIYSHGENKEVHLLKLNPIHPMEFETVKKLIVERTTLSEFEVGFVLGELSTIIIENLQQGRGVRLENLGTFEPSLKATAMDSAEAVDTLEEANEKSIKKKGVRYRPTSGMNTKFGTIKFAKANLDSAHIADNGTSAGGNTGNDNTDTGGGTTPGGSGDGGFVG